ncbi:expressed unknown protein [Seminavis robusta]|uniref:Fe2OG dioxygenase domain-containing protein n=1 Tax=Seminavis robusta TaxID=568900 RepID=A0A9N8DXH6_9STRA|nr:expressed unknown protein [Seminavis robusta]|eukprot:Sro320_g116530.1 n/a (287) ;mRNA; r:46517-47377
MAILPGQRCDEEEEKKEDPMVQEILIRGGAPLRPDHELSTSLSLGERITKGKTILLLSNLVTPDELDYLVESSIAAADAQTDKQDGDMICTLEEGYKGKVFIRMPLFAAAQRENCTDGLPESISLKLEEILWRALDCMDRQVCPSLKATVLNVSQDDNTTDASMAGLFHNQQLQFSIREPAINVYRAPHGHFAMHKDGRDLTILMSLSDPTQQFTGGGTAFWSQSFPHEGLDEPSLILAPPPGTAMVFGGKVSHKGCHIRTGTRVMFVASFNRPMAQEKEEETKEG